MCADCARDYHPRAGDLWADKLFSVPKAFGFEAIDKWPSLYVEYVGNEAVVIDVGVDDLIMYGPRGKGGLRDIIAGIRKQIRM